jgi:chemotaxis protein MotB
VTMRHKRKKEEPENADRWVVSYADFITLLFAFFTTMYAISHVDAGKLARFSGSMKSAFKVSGAVTVDTSVIEGIKPVNYADIGLERDVQAEFKKFDIMEGIAIMRDQRGVVISMGDTLLFESGSSEIRREARPLLSTVASLIKKYQRSIIIEGHTDNIPLRGSRYASNLELSTARASRTYVFLLEEEAVRPEGLSAAGYGEYRPIASNATVEGRARNRRVDIIFVAKKDDI